MKFYEMNDTTHEDDGIVRKKKTRNRKIAFVLAAIPIGFAYYFMIATITSIFFIIMPILGGLWSILIPIAGLVLVYKLSDHLITDYSTHRWFLFSFVVTVFMIYISMYFSTYDPTSARHFQVAILNLFC